MYLPDRIASRTGTCALFGLLAVFCFDGCLSPQSGGASNSGGASGSTSAGGSGGTAGAGGSGGAGGSSVGGADGSGGSEGKGGSSATGGSTSTGGAAGSGGSTGSGGATGGSGGTGGSSAGGAGGRGGSSATGGTNSTGGSAGAGGSAGGSGGTGTRRTGGAGGSSSGGTRTTGGATSMGGSTGVGGSAGSGGSTASGGSSGTGGTGTGGSGGSGGGNDGCTDQLASNLTLSQVAVYQTVKIPIMKSGSEVAASARNSHVVQGHDTVFRLFVTPGSGWTARELSARLTLTPGSGTPAVYYSKKSISAASTDADPANSFQIDVPANAMTAGLRYSVEIVECGTQSGSPGATRFPTTGDLDLGVKSPGGLKMTIIPLKVGSYLPDTSETALAVYTDLMEAMYPAQTVTFAVGTTLTAALDGTGAVDWEGMLDQVQSQRTADKPANDVYYFGLVKPADTFKNYCVRSCITGIGYVVTSATGSFSASSRAAVGIGWADKQSSLTMAHEVGHNHGREHAPCGVSPSDPKYPYSGGLIGSWGYDARTKTLLDPAKYADIMSYCSNQWISDYTYSALTTRIAAVNGATLRVYTTPEAPLARWRILHVSSRKGVRWGASITDEAPAESTPEMATVQDAAGNSIATVMVYRAPVAGLDAAMVLVPEPETGWYSITVAGAPAIPFAPPTQ